MSENTKYEIQRRQQKVDEKIEELTNRLHKIQSQIAQGRPIHFTLLPIISVAACLILLLLSLKKSVIE